MEVADWPPPQAPYTLLGLLLWGQTGTHVPFRSPGRGFAPGIDASLFLSIYIERGIVVLQWLVLLVVTGFLLRRLLTTLRLWNATKNIPGPPWGSFFGDTRGCPSGEDFNGYLSKMHELYGSTVKVWLTPTELLVSFKDPLVIRDILFKVKDKFPLFGRALRLAFGRCNLFSPLYEEVKPRRAILELNLNKFLLTKSKTISFEVLERVLKRDHLVMFEHFLDCYSVSQHFAFYFLGATLFGSSFFLWQSAAICEELIKVVSEDANLLASNKIPPFWRRRFWRHCWLCYKLKCLSLELIQQCTKNDSLSEQNYQIHTGRSNMFCLDDTASDTFRFQGIYQCLVSENESCGNIMGVMLHGFLRISNLIYHLLSRLVLQPELQEQMYAEIKEFQNGASGSNSFYAPNMQLLMATVYESIQLLPAGPLLQRCSTKQSINFRSELTVPEGALLVVPVLFAHRDCSLRGKDACQFSPQHITSEAGAYDICDAKVKPTLDYEISSFRDTQQEETKSKHDKHLHIMGERNKTAAIFPFGLGPRACVGQKFVIQAVSTLLASLLLHYQVKTQPGLPNHIKRDASGLKEETPKNRNIALLKRK